MTCRSWRSVLYAVRMMLNLPRFVCDAPGLLCSRQEVAATGGFLLPRFYPAAWMRRNRCREYAPPAARPRADALHHRDALKSRRDADRGQSHHFAKPAVSDSVSRPRQPRPAASSLPPVVRPGVRPARGPLLPSCASRLARPAPAGFPALLRRLAA